MPSSLTDINRVVRFYEEDDEWFHSISEILENLHCQGGSQILTVPTEYIHWSCIDVTGQLQQSFSPATTLAFLLLNVLHILFFRARSIFLGLLGLFLSSIRLASSPIILFLLTDVFHLPLPHMTS